jgi:hypothetical protein
MNNIALALIILSYIPAIYFMHIYRVKQKHTRELSGKWYSCAKCDAGYEEQKCTCKNNL